MPDKVEMGRELIRPKAIFMREEKVAVENPWAANRHYSSSLPSVKKNQCQMIQYGFRLMPILK